MRHEVVGGVPAERPSSGAHAAANPFGEGVGRAPLYMIVLAVLGVHGLIAVGLRHVLDENMPTARSQLLNVEFDVSMPTSASTSRMPEPATPGHSQPTAPALRALERPLMPQLHEARDAHSRPAPPARMPAISPQSTREDTKHSRAPEPQGSLGSVRSSGDRGAAVAESKPLPTLPPATEAEGQPVSPPDFGAAYLHNPAPPYPVIARQRGWEGRVLLKVHVLASGQPDEVTVAATSGHDSLDVAAVEAVSAWRFVSARRGQQPVDGWVRIPIDFKLGT
ncbi:energy transducer TonB [Paraburkholderia elongata]|nr:energy transducer TonB [Paraburkholderia elongata]